MKTEDLKNLSLQQIVEQLQNQNLLKQDFVVPSKYLKMNESNLIVLNESKLDSLSKLLIDTGISVNENELEKIELSVLDCCHSQIGQRLDIPKKYYDKMLSNQRYHHILDYNVTNWFSEKNENNFLLRTFIDNVSTSIVIKKITIQGYAQPTKIQLSNIDIDIARANSVAKFLKNEGVSSKFIVEGKGLAQTKKGAKSRIAVVIIEGNTTT